MWPFKKKYKITDEEYRTICDMVVNAINKQASKELKKEPEPDPLDEIEVLFDKIKESDLLQSNVVEHNETVSSRLIVAYYLCKLERKIK
ncbi:hypothetical protein KAR91_28245 [Candidatus Pacearchaeota archaeon]|nr:hypothetical protein [Candidatus Pacearchaeota archaeon]